MSNEILVIGDIMLDEYQFGETNRISPEAPVPVINIKKYFFGLGGAGNVLNNLISLNIKCSILTSIGEDSAGSKIKELIEEINPNNNFIIKSKKIKTIKKLRIISQSQQIIRVDYEEKIDKIFSKKIIQKYMEFISCHNPRIIILSDYNKGILTKENIRRISKYCIKNGIKLFIDPKEMDISSYSNCYLLKPNQKEFKNLFGFEFTDKYNKNNLINLLKINSISNLLITLGKRGMVYFSDDGNEIKIPSETKEVYDVTGAGDTVISILAANYLNGLDIRSSISISNKAVALTLDKMGASSLTAKEYLKLIEPYSNSKDSVKKIIKTNNVKQNQSIKKQKIVFTNGCFDVIHYGHIKYLEKAKNLGDLLIVGINTDASVISLKGKSRPINNLLARVEILKSLKMVDKVIPFEEETPIDLIKSILPDVLVKGADYIKEEIVGYDFVKSYGGEIVTIPFEEGYSSSSIIDKIYS